MTRAEAHRARAQLDRALIATDWRRECRQVDGEWVVRVWWVARTVPTPGAIAALERVLAARGERVDPVTRVLGPR